MKLSESFDVIVIGGGILGASIFYELTCQGFKTILVERGLIAQGATGYSGGIVRCFHPNSKVSDMAIMGYEYYRNFENITGKAAAFNETGFIYLDKNSSQENMRNEAKRLSAHIDIEWLDQVTAEIKFPYLKLSEHQGLVYEPKAGYMDPKMTTKAWVEAGEEAGGRVLEGINVEKLIAYGNRFIGVQTNVGPIYSNRVIVCAGALIPSLLAKSQLTTDIYAQAIQVNRYHCGSFPDSHPAFIDDEFDLNGRPDNDNHMLAGYPTHDRSFVDENSPVDLSHTEMALDFLEKRFNWVRESDMGGGFRCFDSYTENGFGEIRFVDTNNTVAVAGGFSGGGFKLAPAIAAKVSHLLKH